MQRGKYQNTGYGASESVGQEIYSQYLPQPVVDLLIQQQHQARYRQSNYKNYSLQRCPSQDSLEDMYYDRSGSMYNDPYYRNNFGGMSPGSSGMSYTSQGRTRKMSRVNSQESFNNLSVNDKFRLLPCRTFISTGCCPYHDKCVFLHDPRVAVHLRVETKGKVYKTSTNHNIIL